MDELIQKLEILASEYAHNSQSYGDDMSFSHGYWAGKLGGISDAIMYAKLVRDHASIDSDALNAYWRMRNDIPHD